MLLDVVRSVGERMPRKQVDEPFRPGLSRRIGDVGRPFARREDEVAARLPVAVVAVRVVAVHLARESPCGGAAHDEVDRRASYVVLRRCAVHDLRLFDALHGCRAQQGLELRGVHRRRTAVQDHRDAPRARERQRPLPFGDARQLRERLVGVVHRLAPDHGLKVVGQPALLDPHHGPLAFDDDGADSGAPFVQGDGPRLAARSGESGEFVGNVLEQQTVGLHGRDDLETAFRVGRCGRDVGRVGVEHHDRHPRHGPSFGILDAAAHAGTPFLRAGGRRDGIRQDPCSGVCGGWRRA